MYGVYIHIPFCIQKCNYCDFASYPNELCRQNEYIDAVLDEAKEYRGANADTIYIGGGTPTCLNNDSLEKLLTGINDIFCIDGNAEFTVEANPGTLDGTNANILRSNGVNRISIGAQSFSDSELVRLGRIHGASDIKSAFETARSAGINNISLDIMYALPGQTMKSLGNTLDSALKLKPNHLSCYGLKYEPGTPFYNMLRSGKIDETDDDTFADMYSLICSRLSENGYCHYEISNFSMSGFESRHNLKYWNREDYIGLGAAAASCVGNRRWANTRSIDEYMFGNRITEDYTMSDSETMHEFIILALRVIKTGVDKNKFRELYNVDFDDMFGAQMKKFSQFLINDKNSVKLTEQAALVSNSILCEFVK